MQSPVHANHDANWAALAHNTVDVTMGDRLELHTKLPNSRTVRLLMWLALASALVSVVSAVFSKWVFAVLGFGLLLLFQRLGTHYAKRGIREHEQRGLICPNCGNRVDELAILRTPAPDRIARCTYCGEPVGTLEASVSKS